MESSPRSAVQPPAAGRQEQWQQERWAYYDDQNEAQQAEFREQALIPKGVSLEFQDFEEPYNKRKALMGEKLKELLTEASNGPKPIAIMWLLWYNYHNANTL